MPDGSARDSWQAAAGFAMEPGVTRDAESGLTLLDVLVALALLAILVWALRMDWAGRRQIREEPPPTAVAQR